MLMSVISPSSHRTTHEQSAERRQAPPENIDPHLLQGAAPLPVDEFSSALAENLSGNQVVSRPNRYAVAAACFVPPILGLRPES
jgi:hypothetical protein